MTRGPLPQKAISKAQDIAIKRGNIMSAEEVKESHHDFTIFGPRCTVYVRVKRIRTHVTNPQEIVELFNEDVHMIRRVPLTPVIAREIWTLSPWDCWQYFLVLDDRIIEIHRDGTPVLSPGSVTEKKPAVASQTEVTTGITPVTTGGPASGENVPAVSPGTGTPNPFPVGTPG